MPPTAHPLPLPRVHILENNEGLLERDFANYEAFYKSFGLTCSKSVDATSDICYCLKKQNNAYFNEQILRGELDLGSTVLIVDEVDDLVVNEKPTLLYTSRDESLTPFYKMSYRALIKGEGRPLKVDSQVWNACKRIKVEADGKAKGVHYDKGERGWVMLEEGPDGLPRMPKVPLTDDWLVYKNYADFDLEPSKNTFRNCLCTPFMYTKYASIFGLTGSVGGEAEREYIRKTYRMVPFEVPQFLTTCDHTTKTPAKNLGVTIKPRFEDKIAEVVRVAKRYHTQVPVLIITQGNERDELALVVRALSEALTEDPHERLRSRDKMSREWEKLRKAVQFCQATAAAGGGSSVVPVVQSPGSGRRRVDDPAAASPKATIRRSSSIGGLNERIQILQERDENGVSLIDQCNVIIDQATKRCFSEAREPFFRVTVTDWFGGRGHDFDCLSEDANAAGGMLVIATSIPDAREWAQWKGRTARQDRPGQFCVVLSEEDEPFTDEPELADAMQSQPPDAIIAELLRRKDAGTAAALASFQAQQARGAWQNELCERYFRANPRPPEAGWPLERVRKTDLRLRDMLSVPYEAGVKLQQAASERLDLSLSGPPAHWGWEAVDEFGIEGPRQEMAVIFLIDRTFEAFLQKVVDAVLKIYDTYLLPTDLVGYYGLGQDWIFGVQEKGDGAADAALREQIAGSVKKAGDPHVYSSVQKCVQRLQEVDDKYAKWLVVLTDTADFECYAPNGKPDKQSPARAEVAVNGVLSTTQAMEGLSLVIIDASGIANFNAKHSLWPTWRKMSQRLTDEVGELNTGLNIAAANVSEIDEAFEKVAGAMTGGAAG